MRQVGEAGEPELAGDVAVRVDDVGGIEETLVSFEPGVTVLRGRNATNRSSLLRAMAAALGSDAAALRAGSQAGRVELTVGEETWTRVFERTPDGVRTGGEPYLADPTVAEHFAFCFEENPARRAVEGLVGDGDGLREVLMAPVDTDRIEAEVERLREERAGVDDELVQLDELEAELPELEARRTSLEGELEAAREELEAAEERVAALESDVASEPGAAAVEERLAELREARSALEDARYDFETERETAGELCEDRAAIEDELEGVDPVPEERLATLDDRVADLRSERSTVESEIGELQSVIRFNEEMLEERAELFEAEAQRGTERLLDAERTVDCWTCGSTVDAAAVETTLEHLRDRRQRAIDRRGDLADRIDELEAERSTLEDRQEHRRTLERRLESVDEELERVEAAIERRREAVARRETAVEELEAELASLGGDESASPGTDDTHGATGCGDADDAADRSEVLVERHRDARDLAVRVDRLESELADVEERIEQVEAELQHRDELEDRREAISEQMEELRTRVERVERAVVEAFNEHVEAVLDVLDYDNLERVWLERRTRPSGEGDGGSGAGGGGGSSGDGGAGNRRRFAHHVVRASDDGRTFEDDVANLSESEREVIGLVAALAGYLVHDVAETVPFLLLDSLEAVDADRIAALVDYLADHAAYLVVALLPEDARALDDGYEYVDEI